MVSYTKPMKIKPIVIGSATARTYLEYIEIALALLLLIIGASVASPWWTPSHNPSLNAAVNAQFLSRYSVATFLVLIGGIDIYNIFRPKESSLRIRQMCMMSSFVVFLFLTILRIVTISPEQIIWMAPLTLSVISGIIRVYLRTLWE